MAEEMIRLFSAKREWMPSLKREWVKCPNCNTKIAIADSDSVCRGVHIKCRTCKTEVEIRI